MSRRLRSAAAEAPVITAVIPRAYASRATVGAKYGQYMRAGNLPVKFTDKIIVDPVTVGVLQRELYDVVEAGSAECLVVHYCIGRLDQVLSDPLHPIARERGQEDDALWDSDKTFARVMFFIVNHPSDDFIGDFIDVSKFRQLDFLFARPSVAETELQERDELLDGVLLTSTAYGRIPEETRAIPPLLCWTTPNAEYVPSVQLTDNALAAAPGWFACVTSEPLHVGVGHGAHAQHQDPSLLTRLEGIMQKLRFKCKLAGAAFADAVLPPLA